MTVSFINVPPIYFPVPPAKRRWNKLKLRTYLHGGGVPQIGEVTCGGSLNLSYKRDPIKMRDYMDRRVTPYPYKQAPQFGIVWLRNNSIQFNSLFIRTVSIDYILHIF